MAKFFSRTKMTSATTGTGTLTLGTAVSNAFFTFAESGVANGNVVPYVIEDGTDFEFGIGTYTSSGTTLSRDTVRASKIAGTAGTSKINCSGTQIVYIDAAAIDLLSITETQLANLFLGGPASGGALAPTFRALGFSDFPVPLSLLRHTLFTANGTWTKGANTTRILPIVTAGGGGGGGAGPNAGPNFGAGGGAGATTISLLDVTGVASYSIVVGAGGAGGANTGTGGTGGTGGDSTINTTTVVAKGGPGGAANASGPAGGAASGGTGDIKADGGPGGSVVGASSLSGCGGTSWWGAGAKIPTNGTDSNGVNGGNYGAGGSGAIAVGVTGFTGGAGGGGSVWILELA